MNSIKYPTLKFKKYFQEWQKKSTGDSSLEWPMTSLGYVEIQCIYINIVCSEELPTNF